MKFLHVARESLYERAVTLLFLACIFAAAAISEAAEYPTKTMQIINPFPPGAVTDIVARIVAPKMTALLGQQVIIVNKAGGGGAVVFRPPRTLRRTVTRFSSRRRRYC